MIISLSDVLTEQLIGKISSGESRYEYDPGKHRLIMLDEAANPFCYIRMPLNMAITEKNITDNHRFIILLIRSGDAATGFVEGPKLTDHKVFRAYMVRKKQGKSQVKYLKTKGKSRAGSRIRLANTLRFFEDINTRLQKYFKSAPPDRIAISCSKILMPYLFRSKTKCPFDKSDKRLYRIPLDIRQPNLKELNKVKDFLLKGDVHFDEYHTEKVKKMLAEFGIGSAL